jgi:hypothetical protein
VTYRCPEDISIKGHDLSLPRRYSPLSLIYTVKEKIMEELKYVVSVSNIDYPEGKVFGLFDSLEIAKEYFMYNFVDSDYYIYPITITDWE